MALVRLPSQTGSFARRASMVDAERLAAIQHFIAKLWSPFDCPGQFLPHLAWALSVDVWDENWNEIRKRQMIAAAPEIHRRKGTDRAVELALDAFDLTYQDLEWWETNPIGIRGTFKIDVLHELAADFISADLREQIGLAVKAAKPKSRPFQINHIMASTITNYVGAFPSFGGLFTAAMPNDNPTPKSAIEYMAVVSAFGGTFTAGMEI